MTKCVTFSAIAVCLVSSITRAASPASPDNGPRTTSSNEQDAASPDWLTSYYQNPQPEHFAAGVRQMSQRGTLSAPVTRAFLSRVLASNPAKIPVWMAALADLSRRDKEELHEAIWLSGTDAGYAYLQGQGLAHLLKTPAPDLLKIEIDSPAAIDRLWGYFFATGDEAPIRRIVSALSYSKYAGALERYATSTKTPDDMDQACHDAVFRAAVSSLSTFSRQHPRVKEVCNRLLKGHELNRTDIQLLKQVLANLNAKMDASDKASPSRSVEDSTGSVENEYAKEEQGFFAMLVFSDEPQQFLDDWNRPGATAHIRMSQSASRGKPCVAFILFGGCGADAQGLGDVVADISMLTPEGKVLGERKAVDICKQRPAPQGNQQQLGVDNLGMIIEPSDPAGTYEVRAKVSDRIKGAVLELKATFSVDKQPAPRTDTRKRMGE